MKRNATVLYLGAGDRDEIINIFPYADTSEDDSGSPQTQALIDVKPMAQYGLDTLVLAQCARTMPPDVDGYKLYLEIDREVKRSYCLNELSKKQDPTFVAERLWFLVTWETTKEEEAGCGSVYVH